MTATIGNDPTGIPVDLYGGLSWDCKTRQFHPCFSFDYDVGSWSIPSAIPHLHAQAARKHDGQLSELQKAVGRVVVFTIDGSHVPKVQTHLSGLFISPKHFLTRSHQLEKHEVLKNVLHKVTTRYKASLDTLEHGGWHTASLSEVNLELDYAVFTLTEHTSPSIIPLSTVYTGEIKQGDFVVAIGYNGNTNSVKLAEAHKTWIKEAEAKLPDDAPLPYAVSPDYADQLLWANLKSLMPGCVLNVLNEQENKAHECFAGVTVESSWMFGCSGGPIFLLRDAQEPVLIGSVYGGEVTENFNIFCLFNPVVCAALKAYK